MLPCSGNEFFFLFRKSAFTSPRRHQTETVISVSWQFPSMNTSLVLNVEQFILKIIQALFQVFLRCYTNCFLWNRNYLVEVELVSLDLQICLDTVESCFILYALWLHTYVFPYFLWRYWKLVKKFVRFAVLFNFFLTEIGTFRLYKYQENFYLLVSDNNKTLYYLVKNLLTSCFMFNTEVFSIYGKSMQFNHGIKSCSKLSKLCVMRRNLTLLRTS